MRRTIALPLALAVVAAALVAIFVTTRGDDAPADAPEAGAGTDVSRQFDRDLLERQAREQAEQVQAAQDELAAEVTAAAKQQVRKGVDHQLVVAIREVGEHDAYRPDGAACVRATAAPSQLVVTDTSGASQKVLIEREIPAMAQLRSDGSCEARMTVTIRYARAYRLGVAIEGRGISSPSDPEPTDVVPHGASQQVLVLR